MSTNDDPRPEDEWVTPPPAAPEPAPPGRTPTRYRRAAQIAAFLVAGLLVGGGASFVLHRSSGSTASAGTPAASFGLPQGSGGARGFRGGPPGGGGGPVAGERHVQGTVTATTASTVTVKSSSATATYTVNATTEIVRNGRASTLSAIKVGDPVLVHVFPSASGGMLVERLFAGSSASDTGPPGLGPPGSGGAGA